MINKKGFTLSEVMVAIGVLGVLAALLIPAIMNTSPDSSKIMFKKANVTLQNSIEELINDDTNYPEDITGTCKDGTVTVNCGFSNITLTANIPAGNNKFCYLLADKLNTVGTVTCPTTGTGSFTTTDGVYWQVYSPAGTEFPTTSSSYNTTITVDVNGTAKKPNCSVVAFSNPTTTACAASTAPDTFKFGVRYDGKLRIDPLDTAAVTILQNPTNNKKD